MTLTRMTDPEWMRLAWPALTDVTSWPGLLVLLGVMLVPWMGRCIGRMQDHFEVKMILREAPGGSVVARQKRGVRSGSTLVVWVGDGPRWLEQRQLVKGGRGGR